MLKEITLVESQAFLKSFLGNLHKQHSAVCVRYALFISVTLIGCARKPRVIKFHTPALTRIAYNFHTVEPHQLYRSAQLPPKILKHFIKKYQIKTVINLRGENTHKIWWQQENALLKKLHITFFNLPLSAAHKNSAPLIQKLLYLYNTAPRPILIHCYSGADRTGEAAALWVLEQQQQNKRAALNQLTWKFGHFSFRYPKKRQSIKNWPRI